MDDTVNNFENQNETVPLNLSAVNLKNLSGWATFRGVMDIIMGILSCLGIITAVYGVLQIIAGVRLLNAAEEIRNISQLSDAQTNINFNNNLGIIETFNKLNSYFKFYGISTIIRIIMGIIAAFIWGTAIFYILSSIAKS